MLKPPLAAAQRQRRVPRVASTLLKFVKITGVFERACEGDAEKEHDHCIARSLSFNCRPERFVSIGLLPTDLRSGFSVRLIRSKQKNGSDQSRCRSDHRTSSS